MSVFKLLSLKYLWHIFIQIGLGFFLCLLTFFNCFKGNFDCSDILMIPKLGEIAKYVDLTCET